MNEACPICQKPDCKGYPYMWAQFAAGRNRRHWLKIHEFVNGSGSTSVPDDIARAAALIAEEYPPGTVTTGVPTGRKCCG